MHYDDQDRDMNDTNLERDIYEDDVYEDTFGERLDDSDVQDDEALITDSGDEPAEMDAEDPREDQSLLDKAKDKIRDWTDGK